jgi:hypothetical protein
VRVGDSVNSIVSDIENSGFDDIVLVGHKMAGLAMPQVMARVAHKLRHVVFVACYILPEGASVLETIPSGLAKAASDGPTRMSREMTIAWECYDMDAEQTAFTLASTTEEAYWPPREPMDITGLDRPIPRTWVRLLTDRSCSVELQDDMAIRAGCDEVIDFDSGHLVMVRHPVELAALLNEIHARYEV